MSRKVDIVTTISSSWRIPYLENCLRGLSCQKEYGDNKIRVIVVCMCQHGSSDTSLVGEVNKIAESAAWGFDVVQKVHPEAYSSDKFPLSLSRNIGARISDGDIVGFLDCDVVADPMTIESVLRIIPSQNKAALSIVFRMPHKPSDVVYKDLDVTRFRKNRNMGRIEKKGKGGCFFIDREILFKIRGYDERLIGWGYEDDDMMARLKRINIHPYDLSKEGVIAMHQFHSVATNTKHTWGRNHKISIASGGAIRNPGSWGRVSDK